MSLHDEPSHDDLAELDLTAAQADDLTALLRGAAARVEVPAPAAPVRYSSRRPPTRWLAAAALVVVAAIGAGWWFTADDGERVQSGPADPSTPPVTVAPHVLEQTGVWRLPEGLDGYELVAAQSTGFSSGWEGSAPGRLAVDDPADPQRWMLVEAYNQFGVPPATARAVELSDEVNGFTVSWGTSGPIWFQLEPTSVDAVVSGAVSGIGQAELERVLAEVFAAPGNLSRGEGFDASIDQLTERFALTDGTRFDWDGSSNTTHGGAGARPSIELTLMGDPGVPNPGDGPGGPEVAVQIAGTDGAPAWAQLLRFELSGDLSLIAAQDQGLAGPPTYSMRRRPDLGRNVIETLVARSGTRSPPLLSVFTDDGVLITANLALVAVDIVTEALSEAEQLRIINSLVAMSEDEFAERLSAAGVEFGD